uniref:Uncharacterized protein n=1 Tax=Arundo donax TaxID=35708 RepID=A0A0A8YND6_ARUDO
MQTIQFLYMTSWKYFARISSAHSTWGVCLHSVVHDHFNISQHKCDKWKARISKLISKK